MKKLFYLSLGLIFIYCQSNNSSVNSPYTLIDNISVVDVINGELIPNQTIVLQDSIILKIHNSDKVPTYPHSEVIDGKDKYIMPGLWDMHFHLCWERSNDSLLFPTLLSHGITGIRDMGGDLRIQNEFKALMNKDPVYGPNIYGAGPIMDGNPPVFYDFTIPLDSASNVSEILDSTTSLGADFIKTYSLLKEPELRHIATYSKNRSIPFAGHLSQYIAPELSLSLGQKSVEHLNVLDDIWEESPERIDTIIDYFKKYESWICPTLVVYNRKSRISDSSFVKPEYDQFIHPVLMKEWQSSRERRVKQDQSEKASDPLRKWNSQLALLNHMHQNDVKILAGSDFGGMPYVYPGIGLHQELQLLNKAGLSNAEAIATATINPAVFMSIDDKYGSVTEGKIADLLILDKNPLANLEHISSIKTIFRKGEILESLNFD